MIAQFHFTAMDPQLRHFGLQDALPMGDVLYELVDGQLVEKRTTARTSWIASQLSRKLSSHMQQRQDGQVILYCAFILNESGSLRRRPDLAFIPATKWPLDTIPPLKGDWNVIPELAVEITIPTESIANVMRKLRDYFRSGVHEVWVVIPEERIVQVYRALNDVQVFSANDEICSETFPGWSMPVVELLPHDTD